jgi:hypothetical protein
MGVGQTDFDFSGLCPSFPNYHPRPEDKSAEPRLGGRPILKTGPIKYLSVRENVMAAPDRPRDTLFELESRHEELLEQLDELDKRVQQVLNEYQSDRSSVAPQPSSPAIP